MILPVNMCPKLSGEQHQLGGHCGWCWHFVTFGFQSLISLLFIWLKAPDLNASKSTSGRFPISMPRFHAAFMLVASLAKIGFAEDCAFVQTHSRRDVQNKTLEVIKGGVLKKGMVLPQNVRLLSEDERFGFVMQSDGNLVQQYKRHDGTFWGTYHCWAFYDGPSGFGTRPFHIGFKPYGPHVMAMVQEDADGRTWLVHGPCDEFIVQNDGNLVWKFAGEIVEDSCSASSSIINEGGTVCCDHFKHRQL